MKNKYINLYILFCTCFCLSSCDSESDINPEAKPFICTNRQVWIDKFGDDRILEKVLNTTIPEMPSYIYSSYGEKPYSGCYIGAYNGYEFFRYPTFTESECDFYSINDYEFEKLIYCAKADENGMVDWIRHDSSNDFADLFSENIFDTDTLEDVYCAYLVRLNEIYSIYLDEGELIFETNHKIDDISVGYVFRQSDIINDVEYRNYTTKDFLDEPVNIISYSKKSTVNISCKAIELGNYCGYDFYLGLDGPMPQYPDLLSLFPGESINLCFYNKYFFNSDGSRSGIFCLKNGDAYTQDKCAELYIDNQLSDSDIQEMAEKTFSYFYDHAENKEEFKRDYISQWNKNYRNPGRKGNLA